MIAHMSIKRFDIAAKRPEYEAVGPFASRAAWSAAAGGAQVVWNPPDVLKLLTALISRWPWILIAPLVGIAATICYLLMANPTYEIGAQLMVRFGHELAAPATLSTQPGQQVVPVSKRPEDTTAEVQIMKDPKLVREVVESLGEDYFYGEDVPVTFVQKMKHFAKMSVRNTKELARNILVWIGVLPELTKLDNVVMALQYYISIEHVTRSDIVELKLSYPDPRAGEEILRRFIAAYLAKREQIYRDRQITTFFAGELDKINKALVSAEESYSADRQKLATWSVDEQRALAVQRREKLLRDLQDAQSSIQVTTEQIAELERELTDLPEWVSSSMSQKSNALREALELKRFELKLQAEAEGRRTGTRSSQVQSLTQQIKNLEEYLAGEPARVRGEDVTVPNPLREAILRERSDARLLVATTRKKAETLSHDLAQITAELEALEEAGLTLTRKQRDVERLRLTQQRFQQGNDEARITSEIAAAQISNVAVIAEPMAGVAPATPRVLRLLVMAIGLSVVAACGLILLFDTLRPKIRSNNDILGLVEGGTIVQAVGESGRR